MPDMDGYEVCRRLKEDAAACDIPVIFLTARIAPEDIVKGFEIGAVDYITKPFNAAELTARVTTQLELALAKRDLIEKNRLLDTRNSELADLIVSKDRFFSIMAHDLKNPFHGMLGYSELLVRDIDDLTLEQVHEYAGIINSLCNHTYDLLERMLEWSRIQMGRLEVQQVELDLSEIVEETLALMKSGADQKGLSLLSIIPHNTIVLADRKILGSVLLNLVSNAVKFSNPKGMVRVVMDETLDGWDISVSDNGIGISPENQEKLFRIDVTLSTPGTAREKGSGMGLLLCRDLLRYAGGDIRFISEPGNGSTFTFTLPKKKVRKFETFEV
jgi:signal transduction histidine kinase